MFIALQSFRPRTFHAREKVSQSDKKKNQPSSSEMPPFYLRLPKVSRVRKKEEKSIEVSKKARNANTRSSLFASIVTTQKKTNGKMRRSSRPCSGRFKKPQEPPRKTYP